MTSETELKLQVIPNMHLSRILLVTENLPPKVGGSGRYFWEIYRRRPASEVVIVAGMSPGQDEFDRSHDIPICRIELTLRSWGVSGIENLSEYSRAVRLIRTFARAHQVGVLHCGRCLPEGLMALALKAWCGLPYLCFAHGEELNYARTSRELTWLARRVLNGSVFVIANSRNTEKILREQWGVLEKRVRILYPGVDVTRFVPAPRDATARAALGWDHRPVVLTVGRLQRRKGHDQMIRALRTVRLTAPDVLYAIIGGGEERECLQAIIDDEGQGGHVQFLGELEDDALVKCYQQCDLFALPNRQDGEDIEGFGMVLVEAQACGKPVIAGASGGTAETLEEGKTGRVVACEDSHVLAAVVAELLADEPLRLRMGKAARERAVSKFDWDALSVEAGRLFAEAAGSSR